MKEQITIVTPQFDRTEKLDFEKPTTEQEFYNIVNNAPKDILFGYGFRVWDKMSNIIGENKKDKDEPQFISLPTYNLDEAVEAITGALDGTPKEPSGSMLYDLGSKENRPTEQPKEDEEVLLFPAEWYDIIPNGFKYTGLWGQEELFEKGKTDDDRRFGCLGYGIRRKVA